MSELATPHIQSTNAKRLIKDIKDILKNPLHNEGIFYQHDTDDMLKGYAMENVFFNTFISIAQNFSM